MKYLSREQKKEIRHHLEKSEGLIKAIESGERDNNEVVNNDFLDPTILMGSFPFNYQKGELAYYSYIRNGLKIALRTGKIPKSYTPYFIRSPEKIRGLLEEDNLIELLRRSLKKFVFQERS